MAEILVIAAHPDDEVLGMGGTIARHTAAGDAVHVAFMTDGVGSRGTSVAAARRRTEAAIEALNTLNATLALRGNFPDNRMDAVPLLSVVQVIEGLKRALSPSIVYTHHIGDLNIDHTITARATATAFRPQPHETYREIRSFEVPSSSEWAPTHAFLPDTYVDVTESQERLFAAYDAYHEEQRPDPHARSPHALALKIERRGREVGLIAAEAFVTVRRIIRSTID